uniref:EF-hand domain-containing protein n=1 Tax=Steinernema glaseri TaxID=37863 RepID=A0A1I7XVP5_9BILA
LQATGRNRTEVLRSSRSLPGDQLPALLQAASLRSDKQGGRLQDRERSTSADHFPELFRFLGSTLAKLERIDEINDITEYFSYAHFFVIYCSFSELDDDKDMQLKPADLKKYDNGGVTSKVIKRIFSGAGMKRAKAQPTMGFSEFAVFMLAEEDKRNPASIAYWFRCLD